MGHPIHKHMHTHITKENVAAAIRDDKAHMDYLKRDVKDDQKFHVADKDARQTHDEQHISNLAQDVKHDEKKEGISRMQSPLNVGPDPLGKSSAPKKNYSFGEKLWGTAKNIGDRIAMIPNTISYGGKSREDVMKDRGHNQYSSPDQGSNYDRGTADLQMRKDRINKRNTEGSAFFRESAKQERKDLMKDNPVDNRAGMSRHTSEHSTEEYMDRKDAAIKKAKGMSRYGKKKKY